MTDSVKYDVFISHASEDKIEVARPLASLLLQAGLKVWLDEFELKLGDSLRRKIDAGLGDSRFGVVVLSKAFFSKEWPKKELDALVAREDGVAKVILPVWHQVTAVEIRKFSPMLADRLGATTEIGIARVASQIADVVLQAAGSESSKANEHRQSDHTDGPSSIQELMVQFLDELQERADSPSEIQGLPTGYYDLDRMMGGLVSGGLYVLAARPSTGATTLAFNIAQHVALDMSLPTLFVSNIPHDTLAPSNTASSVDC
jgi:hypothetical protein